MKKTVTFSIIFIFVVTLMSFTCNRWANALLLPATDQGWYRQDGYHNPAIINHIAGIWDAKDHRNWFVFDTTDLDTVTSAALRINTKTITGTGTYTNYEYSGNINLLMNGYGWTTAYNDLGTGYVFASTPFTSSDSHTIIDITLNSTALASINAASGLWAMGGTASANYIFGYSHLGFYTPQLVVNETAVPEPSLVILLGISLVGLVGAGTVRKIKRKKTIANA